MQPSAYENASLTMSRSGTLRYPGSCCLISHAFSANLAASRKRGMPWRRASADVCAAWQVQRGSQGRQHCGARCDGGGGDKGLQVRHSVTPTGWWVEDRWGSRMRSTSPLLIKVPTDTPHGCWPSTPAGRQPCCLLWSASPPAPCLRHAPAAALQAPPRPCCP